MKEMTVKPRVIEQLRRWKPGRWTYDHSDFAWEHESGMTVRAYARFAPRYDGDDDKLRN